MQTNQSENLTQLVEDLSKQLHGCLEKVLVDPSQNKDETEDSKGMIPFIFIFFLGFSPVRSR